MSWLAIAQPILSVYAQNPDELVRLRVEGPEVTMFALLLTIGPALALWTVTTALSLLPRLEHAPHLLAAGALASLVGAGLARELLDAGVVLAALVAAAVAVALVYTRMTFPAVGSALRMLAVAPGAYLLYFLLASPVTAVLDTSTEALDARSVENPAPIIFLILDELPTGSLLDGDGSIDASLFPAIASLAGDGTWYRNHTTVAPFTTAAVPAILTGMMPTDPMPPAVASAYPQNLFSLLEGTYELNVVESEVTSLCNTSTCRTIAKQPTLAAVGELLDSARSIWWKVIVPSNEIVDPDLGNVNQLGAASPTQLLNDFTDGLRDSEIPRLRFVHALLPHQPWELLPSGHTYNGPNPSLGQTFFAWDDELSAERGRQQHLLQLQYTDVLLGQLLDRLQSLEIYDRALIVVTADHGIAFAPRQPSRGASPTTLDQIMWTPLLIKEPHQAAGAVVDTPARTIDILPTIADILGFEPDEPFDGHSLRKPNNRDSQAQLFSWTFNSFDLDAPGEDGYVRVDGQRWFQQLLATPGVPPDPVGDTSLRLYRVGPHPELIGRSVADMDIADPQSTPVDLNEPRTESLRIAPGQSMLPVFVDGSVQTPLDLPVGVVVNGNIGLVAETRVAPGGDDRHFWGLLPPQLFVDGDNTVEFVLVQSSADGVVLHPFPPVTGPAQALPAHG